MMNERKKVLLVDDDADFLQINRAILEQHGYQVEVAHNGTECMEKVRSEKPDLIVLDLMMSTWSEGMDVAEELRGSDETSAIPLLLATVVNLDMPLASRPSLACDWLIDEYLLKPVEPDRLVQAVERGLARGASRRDQEPAAAGAAPLIMLVDDDPDFLEVNRAVLEAHGYRVACAGSAGEAMDRLRDERPDLVVTDLVMETILAGISFSQKIKSDPALRDVPVMAVTGMQSERGLKFAPTDGELALAGIDRYFEKPIAPETLLAQVQELTGRTEEDEEP